MKKRVILCLVALLLGVLTCLSGLLSYGYDKVVGTEEVVVETVESKKDLKTGFVKFEANVTDEVTTDETKPAETPEVKDPEVTEPEAPKGDETVNNKEEETKPKDEPVVEKPTEEKPTTEKPETVTRQKLLGETIAEALGLKGLVAALGPKKFKAMFGVFSDLFAFGVGIIVTLLYFDFKKTRKPRQPRQPGQRRRRFRLFRKDCPECQEEAVTANTTQGQYQHPNDHHHHHGHGPHNRLKF